MLYRIIIDLHIFLCERKITKTASFRVVATAPVPSPSYIYIYICNSDDRDVGTICRSVDWDKRAHTYKRCKSTYIV